MKPYLFAAALACLAVQPALAEESLVAAQELELKQKELEVAEKKLELEKARKELAVEESETQLSLSLSGDVLFDTGEATLKTDARDKLRQVGTVLAAYPEGQVQIRGYTDSRGSEEQNRELAEKRALAVKTWLMNQSGVQEERITIRALGEENPAATNETASGRQQNRRVEITVNKS